VRTLRNGGELADEVPAVIAQAPDHLDKLAIVLISPGKTHLELLKTLIDTVELHWTNAGWHRRHNPLRESDAETWRRQRDARELQLREAMTLALEHVDKYLKVIVDIDNGSDSLYRSYAS
jgi:hypothetical protein